MVLLKIPSSIPILTMFRVMIKAKIAINISELDYPVHIIML